MANGGTVSIKNPQGVALSVTITATSGSPTFLKSGGGTASFPEAITGDETFATTTDCAVTVSVKYRGREIAGSPDATYATELKNSCYLILSPGPDNGFDFDPGDRTTTTAALNAIANAVNTTGKFAGKVLLNTTTGKLVAATGGAASDTWKSADAVTTYTPA